MGLLKKLTSKIQSQFSFNRPTPQSHHQSHSQSETSTQLERIQNQNQTSRMDTPRKLPYIATSPTSNSDDISNSSTSSSSSSSSSRSNLINPPNEMNSWPSFSTTTSTNVNASGCYNTASVSTSVKFKPGDKVKVIKNVNELRAMQEGHGGWNNKMAKYCFESGFVHRITISGNVRVKFGLDESSPKFTFNPNSLALYKDIYSVGDVIQVDCDMERVKLLQEGHGEWIDLMESIIGKSGKVVALDEDNDLQVLFHCQRIYTLNPLCVSLVSSQFYSSSTLQSPYGQLASDLAAVPPSIYPTFDCCSSVTTHERVQTKPHVSNNLINTQTTNSSSPGKYNCSSVAERLKLLEDKFAEIEEVYSCNICMERVRKIVFMCGHGTCIKCSHSLTSCHMCRMPISRKIHLY